ncbi:hypothetical protein MPL3356_540054 [Mesorhizobium plurifarium]|uniref:Uncharacterized protein n=1 Tax=Mesorhizobium plurifarium TaxID=69974 RepID=A0A090E6R6_MESPL|nr:hypothetical protein MPL3356_540054 [Mesorhizobium plurifarium]
MESESLEKTGVAVLPQDSKFYANTLHPPLIAVQYRAIQQYPLLQRKSMAAAGTGRCVRARG